MELNLRPTSVINAEKIAARRPYFVGAGVCLLLALLGTWLYFLRANDLKTKALADVRARNSSMGEFEKQDNAVIAEINKIKSNASPLQQVVDDRQYWTRVLTGLHEALPEKYIWVTLFEPTSGGKPVVLGDPSKPLIVNAPGAAPTPAGAPGGRPGAASANVHKGPVIDGVHVHGLYLENPQADSVVTAYVKNLSTVKNPGDEKELLFNIDTTNENSVIKNRSPQTSQEWTFDYDLQINLKTPLTIP